jgi:CTP:molybdopterin cytidylyltransferase MocA
VQRNGAVILAAGLGTRLGGVAKALIQVDGVPLVRRQIDALRGAGVVDIVVVTGVHHDAIARSVAGQGVRLVHNAVSGRGQGTSVRLGLQAADPRADGLLLVLCDQALLTSADLADLMAAHRGHGDRQFVVPWVDGSRRGNPVWVSSGAVRAVLSSDRYLACRDYMDAHPESVLRWHTANDHYLVDIDQPQDLPAVAARLGCDVSLPVPGDR